LGRSPLSVGPIAGTDNHLSIEDLIIAPADQRRVKTSQTATRYTQPVAMRTQVASVVPTWLGLLNLNSKTSNSVRRDRSACRYQFVATRYLLWNADVRRKALAARMRRAIAGAFCPADADYFEPAVCCHRSDAAGKLLSNAFAQSTCSPLAAPGRVRALSNHRRPCARPEALQTQPGLFCIARFICWIRAYQPLAGASERMPSDFFKTYALQELGVLAHANAGSSA